MTNVIAIDSPVWIDTFKAGGFAGLNAITASYDNVFVSTELRAEIAGNESNFSTRLDAAFKDWQNSLEAQGSLLSYNDDVTAADNRCVWI